MAKFSKNKTPGGLRLAWDKIYDKYLVHVPFLQRMLFIHHLQIMTKAGLSIISALQILSDEIENTKLKAVATDIKLEVEKGKQLSEAVAKYPKIFPAIYVSMIAAGESSGKMEKALDEIYIQMKKSQELSSKVKGAMIYPAIVMIAMTGIAIEVVVFVLPKLMVLFADFKAELPLPTKILIKITAFGQVIFTTYWGLIALAVIIGLAYAWHKSYAKPEVKSMVHRLILRFPIVGPIIKQINLAHFTLTLSSLLDSAIPIIEAVNISAEVLSNVIYKQNLQATAESLKKGQQLSSILAKYPETFPPMVTEMIMVGEETGEVEHLLKELADYYGGEVDTTMRNFSTVIEPVIILVLGLAVAGIAVAVIMPMYSLAESF
ncbi:MAG: type II secretion system F family protein [bacterium]|nr:type II secretion system F family protein [bacterium]